MNKRNREIRIKKTPEQMISKLQSLELTTLPSPSNKDPQQLISKIKEEGYKSKCCTLCTWEQYFEINKPLKYEVSYLGKISLGDYSFEHRGETISNQELDFIKEFLPNRPKEFFNKNDWLKLDFKTVDKKDESFIIMVNKLLNKISEKGNDNISYSELNNLYRKFQKYDFTTLWFSNSKYFFYNKKENLIIKFNNLCYQFISDKYYKGPNDPEAKYSYMEPHNLAQN